MVKLLPPPTVPRLVDRTATPAETSRYDGLVQQLSALPSLQDGHAHAVGLTSATRGEGVTNTALGLATAAARNLSEPVLLVDANFAQPAVERSLGMQPTAGIREAVAGVTQLPRCIRPTRIRNLGVVGPGRTVADVRQSLDAATWRDLLDEVTSVFALVLIDLPCIEQFGSQVTLAQGVDGVLLVVQAEKARRKAVVRAKQELSRVNATTLGAIFNRRKQHVPGWLYNRI